MSKQLYDEALADVKNLREVAEDDAKRAVFNAVLPRIRELIESHILSEDAPKDQTEDELLGIADGDINPPPHDPIAMDVAAGAVSQSAVQPTENPMASPAPVAAAAISPAPDGGAILDVDVALGNTPAGQESGSSSLKPGEVPQPPTDMQPPPPPIPGSPDAVPPIAVVDADISAPVDPIDDDDEFVLDMEGIQRLAGLTGTPTKKMPVTEVAKNIKRLTAQFISLRTLSSRLTESGRVSERIDKILARVENMYDCVQESVVSPKQKLAMETRLERLYKELNSMKESTMKSKKLREADEDLDLGGDEGDEDLGGGDGGEEESSGGDVLTIKVTNPSNPEEASVELVTGGDEGGEGGDEELDLGDLGGDEEGGDEGGEDLDLEADTVLEIDEGMLRRELRRMRMLREAEAVPSTKGEKPGSEEFDDFGDASSEGEPLDQKITTEGENVDKDESDEECDEGASSGTSSRLHKEHRLQRVLRRRMNRLQSEGMKAQGARRQQYRKAWVRAEHALKESRIRTEKLTRRLDEAKNAGRSNIASRRPAETVVAEGDLRKQLAEKNLLNAKLIYTNKLLQNESLSAKAKANVIERLDEAKTVREAKMVYEGAMTSTKTNSGEKLNESRQMGASSRVARPASTPQSSSESFETARWAKLAGIK